MRTQSRRTNSTPEETTLRLDSRLGCTLAQISQVTKITSERRIDRCPSEELDRHLAVFREALFGELDDMTFAAIDTPAMSQTQLAAKARLFLDYCMPDDGDLAHELARSICRDIVGLSDRGRA